MYAIRSYYESRQNGNSDGKRQAKEGFQLPEVMAGVVEYEDERSLPFGRHGLFGNRF